MCYDCDNWMVSGRLKRREFRQDHGGGPEEIPHRKKGRGKKYCKKNKGEHVYDSWTDWQTYTTWRYRYRSCKCGKKEWGSGYQSQRLVTSTYMVGGEERTYTRWI